MKKIIVILCVICLMSIPYGLSINIPNKLELPKELEIDGNILITEARGNRVIEVDINGNIVWQLTGLSFPLDAERLYNGNTLITLHGNESVIEVSPAGNIVWQKTELSYPVDAERLPNGNTLITEFGAGVKEVDRNGSEVWNYSAVYKPLDAERLPNGNTLIAEPGSGAYPDGRVIEVDSAGNEILNITGLEGPVDVERLYNTPYGNTTLITEHTGKKVTEYAENGTIVWQKTGLLCPNDAERIPNDYNLTLISETGANRTIIVNSTTGNNIVWVKGGLFYPADSKIVPVQPQSLYFEKKVWDPDGQTWVDVLEGVMKGIPVKFKINLTYNGFQDINLMKGMIVEDELPECCLEYIDGSYHIKYPNNDNFTSPEITVSENKKQVIFDWTNSIFNLFVGETIEIEFEANVVEYCYDIVKNFAAVDLWSCNGCPEQVHIYGGGSASVNCSQPPSVKIINPKEGYFHLVGRPLFTFLNITIVYGSINIEVNVTPETEIKKVEFYINDKLKNNDTNPPYDFKWAPILSGFYTIKVIAYNNRGVTASDSIKIFKWRAHPVLILAGFLLIIGALSQK